MCVGSLLTSKILLWKNSAIGSLQLAIHVWYKTTVLECKKVALRQDKQRKLPFQIMYVFCLSSPSATFALQRGCFVPGEWLPAKGLLGSFRACLHGGGGPQVGEETRLGGVKQKPSFTCNLNFLKIIEWSLST